MSDDVQFNPEPGDTMTCPGCGVSVYLDAIDGWRSDPYGYGCKPPPTTHSDHIITLVSD